MITKFNSPSIANFLPTSFGQSAWYQHIPFAYWLIENFKPRSFLEMGTHNGVSYFAFCEAIRQQKLDTKCIAVDNWIGDTQAGIFDEMVFYNFVEAHKKYTNFSSFIKNDFEKALVEIEEDSIDLIHIDGFHSYNSVSTDFDLALEKLNKENGIIILHDINEFQITFGVNKFWRELENRYRTFRFNHGHGLGVVFIGHSLNSKVEELLNIRDSREISSIQDYFEFLGQKCELYAENINLKNKVNLQQNEILQGLSKINELLSWQENAKLNFEREIYQLTNSISWQLTSPLRYLKRIFK
jgi:hypothetical protein